jgi:hypothetical protein
MWLPNLRFREKSRPARWISRQTLRLGQLIDEPWIISPFELDEGFAARPFLMRAKASEPDWIRACNPTVMSGRMSISFVHFTAFSFDFGGVHCALSRSFLARNWCGVHLVVWLNELQPYPNARRRVKGAHVEDAAPSGASQIYRRGRSTHHDRPTTRGIDSFKRLKKRRFQRRCLHPFD